MVSHRVINILIIAYLLLNHAQPCQNIHLALLLSRMREQNSSRFVTVKNGKWDSFLEFVFIDVLFLKYQDQNVIVFF